MRYFYYSLLLLTSLLWAGNFVLGKGLTEHASPMTLTSLRWIIAVVCLVPVVWWKEKRILPPKKALLPLALMGMTGVVLFNILQFVALKHTTATNVGLISTLNMLSIAVFSGIFLKERLNGLQLLSMVFSLFGVLLVLTKGNLSLLLSLDVNSGDLYMLAAVAVWGLYSVFSKWAMAHVSAMFATLYSGIFGLLVLLPINMPSFAVSDVNASFVYAILYTGVVSTVLCFVLWNIGVQKIGATTSGIFLNFNPVFTALLAFILLGEQMAPIQVIGSAIVISGCYFFTVFGIKRTRTKKLESPSYQ